MAVASLGIEQIVVIKEVRMIGVGKRSAVRDDFLRATQCAY